MSTILAFSSCAGHRGHHQSEISHLSFFFFWPVDTLKATLSATCQMLRLPAGCFLPLTATKHSAGGIFTRSHAFFIGATRRTCRPSPWRFQLLSDDSRRHLPFDISGKMEIQCQPMVTYRLLTRNLNMPVTRIAHNLNSIGLDGHERSRGRRDPPKAKMLAGPKLRNSLASLNE
jgi:hypothetical protein